MKITLTQKSEVRPLSDDETETVPETKVNFTVAKYTAINTNLVFVSLLDYNGREFKERFLGIGIVEIAFIDKLNIPNFPRLIKVGISEVDMRLMPLEPIPGFHHYNMLEVL